MKLSEYKDTYEDSSLKLSDINRNVAFAGIGLIWIFTKTGTEVTNAIIPHTLVIPAISLVISLFFDMLQYLYKTIIYYSLFRKNEKLELSEDHSSFSHSIWWNRPIWILFYLKILGVFIAYVFILKFLICTLIKS